MYTCRECERPVNQATEVCPYCGADLTVPIEAEDTAKKRSPLGAVVRWGVLLAAIWGFLWFVLPERRGDTTAQAEAQAIELLRLAQTEQAFDGGGFPSPIWADKTNYLPGFQGETDFPDRFDIPELAVNQTLYCRQ